MNAYFAYTPVMENVLNTDYVEQLAKRGRFRYDIVDFCDIIYIEMIARGTDCIDTGGIML